MSCKNTKQNVCNDYCYASPLPYRLKYFIKTKWFYNYNDLLNHIKHQNCSLISYEDLGGKFKATLRYKHK